MHLIHAPKIELQIDTGHSLKKRIFHINSDTSSQSHTILAHDSDYFFVQINCASFPLKNCFY